MENKAEGNVDKIIKKRFFPENDTRRIFVDVGAPGLIVFLLVPFTVLLDGVSLQLSRILPSAICIKKRGMMCFSMYACGECDEDNVDFFVVDSYGVEYDNDRFLMNHFHLLVSGDTI